MLGAINPVTLALGIGIGILAFLYFARKYLKPLLIQSAYPPALPA